MYTVVTGAAGFIGSNVVKELLDRNVKVICVDNFGSGEKWRNLSNKCFSEFINKDEFISRLENGEWLDKISTIIHLGACSATTQKDMDFLWSNNVLYSRKLALYSIKHKIRFIYASSAATYGEGHDGFDDNPQLIKSLKPTNPYGYSKAVFDNWIIDNNCINQVAGLKFFNVYGPNEYHKGEQSSVVVKAYQQIIEKKQIKLFKSDRPDYSDGEQKRDFVYVIDCVKVILWLMDNPNVSGIFNVGTGEARSWNDLANAIFKSLNMSPNIEYFDMPENLKAHYQYFTQATTKRLTDAGYKNKFTTIEDGVMDYVTNYIANKCSIR
jgi:ADP-L-glycero-D-manno-heptose 6-epimerase